MSDRPPIILFLDQDLGWSRPLRVDLRRRGALVYAVTSIADAFEISARLAPDLIVLDGDLEHLGPEVMTSLVHRQVPAAALAVLARSRCPEVDAQCLRHGALHLALKPADPSAMAKTVDRMFRGRLKAGEETPHERPLVLCVDDDLMYVSAMERLLTRHGYRVATFTHPEIALDRIPDLKPAVAIVDVRMPGMNGFNLAQEILDGYETRIPVVLLTAVGGDRDIRRAYDHGVSYYITKPCEPKVILNIVDYLAGDLDAPERELLEAEL